MRNTNKKRQIVFYDNDLLEMLERIEQNLHNLKWKLEELISIKDDILRRLEKGGENE